MANDITAFIGKAKARAEARAKLSGRMDFLIDATGSREATWKSCSQITEAMFDKVGEIGGGDLTISLGHFGGNGVRWHEGTTDASVLKSTMTEVSCVIGFTQILPALTQRLPSLNEPDLKPACLVYIGDTYEENSERFRDIARKYGSAKVPIFMFLARTNSTSDSTVTLFKEIASLSGGAFAELDESALASFEDMLGAAAAYATGGVRALLRAQAKGSEAATLLLSQMKKD